MRRGAAASPRQHGQGQAWAPTGLHAPVSAASSFPRLHLSLVQGATQSWSFYHEVVLTLHSYSIITVSRLNLKINLLSGKQF